MEGAHLLRHRERPERLPRSRRIEKNDRLSLAKVGSANFPPVPSADLLHARARNLLQRYHAPPVVDRSHGQGPAAEHRHEPEQQNRTPSLRRPSAACLHAAVLRSTGCEGVKGTVCHCRPLQGKGGQTAPESVGKKNNLQRPHGHYRRPMPSPYRARRTDRSGRETYQAHSRRSLQLRVPRGAPCKATDQIRQPRRHALQSSLSKGAPQGRRPLPRQTTGRNARAVQPPADALVQLRAVPLRPKDEPKDLLHQL